jgi:hypothetical protein
MQMTKIPWSAFATSRARLSSFFEAKKERCAHATRSFALSAEVRKPWPGVKMRVAILALL